MFISYDSGLQLKFYVILAHILVSALEHKAPDERQITGYFKMRIYEGL